MAYTPIEWDEITPITPANLDNMDSQIDDNEDDLRTIQGGEVAVDGRITNLEDYIVGNTTAFQSLSSFSTASTSYVTAKEILVGRGGSARLTFETRINGSLDDEYVNYRILVDGSEVASGSHSGASGWVNYTEDIDFQIGSNIKIQIRKDSQVSTTISLRNFRFKIGNQSDNIVEL